MKRDMNLIRAILMKIEETLPEGKGFNSDDFNVEGFTSDEVHYHLALLYEAGLIHAIDVTTLSSAVPQMIPLRLTWEGHEFLEAARSETIWNKAKDITTAKGVGMAFDLMKHLLLRLANEAIESGA